MPPAFLELLCSKLLFRDIAGRPENAGDTTGCILHGCQTRLPVSLSAWKLQLRLILDCGSSLQAPAIVCVDEVRNFFSAGSHAAYVPEETR